MVTINRATAADVEVLAVLIGEIETYYGGRNVPGAMEQIRAALFGERPAATVLLAREGDVVLGMASYSFLWPAAGGSTSLYLKELFVRETARRHGVGAALLANVKEVALEAGCSRVEWTADHDNPLAQSFYDALGAERHDGKVFYRAQTSADTAPPG